MTHTFDYRTAKRDARRITIGERSIITTRCTILPGVKIAGRIIVAAGSVVPGQCRKPGFLYAGVPAEPVRELDFQPALPDRRAHDPLRRTGHFRSQRELLHPNANASSTEGTS